MKILLLGDDSEPSSIVNFLRHSEKYKIHEAHNIEIATQLLKASSPDFVVCAGRIQKNEEGEFYLEI